MLHWPGAVEPPRGAESGQWMQRAFATGCRAAVRAPVETSVSHSRTSGVDPTTAFTPAEAAARPTRPRSDSRADATARSSPSRDPAALRSTPAVAAPRPDRDPRRRQPRVHRRQRRPRPARRLRNLRQRPAVGPREADRARVVKLHLQAAFVHRPVMPPAKLHQVVEPGRAAVRPVPDVVRIAPPGRAAREAATPIPRRERTAQRRRDRARLPADAEHLSGGAVGHDDPSGVARQPARRFRGDAQPAGVLQHRLTVRGASSVAET